MPARKFFTFAWRIAAYGGMVAKRIEAQNHVPEPATPAAGPVERVPRRSVARPVNGPGIPQGATVVPVAGMAAMIPGLIEIHKVTKPE